MSLSVIIVSYNTKQLLSDCLKSVYKSQSPKDGLEVIVVDNNSPDDSVQMVQTDFPQVKLIANQDNKGFAAANNQAAAIAQGKYLLFLNSDTKLTPHALVKPLKYLRTHQDVGAITIKLLLPTGQIDLDNHRGFPTPWTALTKILRLNTLFPNSRLFNNYYQSYKGYDRIHSIDVAAGSYIMLSKKLFDKIGGWDESYFFYGEDIDLCYRIRQNWQKNHLLSQSHHHPLQRCQLWLKKRISQQSSTTQSHSHQSGQGLDPGHENFLSQVLSKPVPFLHHLSHPSCHHPAWLA